MTKNKAVLKSWLWVPSTFFMEGVPGMMIMMTLSIMYKNFGVSNADITFYTGMLVMPWVIKPLWASFIDIVFTKRWWIYTMEIAIGGAFILMAFVVKSSNFFILSIILAWLGAFLSASHDIATDGFYIMELDPSLQSFFVGVQSASYNLGKIFSTGLIVMLCGIMYSLTNSYFTAWFSCLIFLGAVCILIGFYHMIILPRQSTVKNFQGFKHALHNFADVYVKFIKIDGLTFALLFLFFFKLSESMIGAILPLFLVDKLGNGGLQMTNTFTGFAYGTIAPISIILGGFLGGYAIYKKGFMYWIWLMLIAVNAPNAIYIFLAYFQTQNHLIIISCIAFEQFCFSFGYTAYIIFVYYMVKDSMYKTAHYAFFAGVMLLGIMIPKMVSGYIQQLVGYTAFFMIVVLAVIPTALIITKLKMTPYDYGKRK